jgi:transcriptional regulator with XRE-family HTH domain
MFTVGDKIKYFRKQRGMTQAQLAELTGIHPVSIRKYEINKMQPQSQQVERIAEALRVNSGALSSSNSDIIHMETKGDLMSLLMLWHKSGILSIEGERGEDNLLDAATVRLQPNTVFGTYLALSCDQAKKEEVIQLDNLSVVLQDKSILQNLLRWESLYNGYVLMSEKYGDSDNEPTLTALNELRENLELIEMELQGSMEPLK